MSLTSCITSRFQDDDDIFGLDTKPSPRLKSPATKGRLPPPDMEWLEMAAEKPPATTVSSVNAQAGSMSGAIPTSASPGTLRKAATIADKPPTPPKQDSASRSPGSPQKLGGKNPSPRAWLGLADSDSDGEEFFMPKKSSARSAALPQGPASSLTASPKVTPKKPTKKDNLSPKVPLSPGGDGGDDVGGGDDDDDDWLARAKSRRLQMLKREESKDELKAGAGVETPNEISGSGRLGDGAESLRVDLSSVT